MTRLASIATSCLRRRLGLTLGLAVWVVVAAPAPAQVLLDEPPENMQGLDIDEKRGDSLPLDLHFMDSRGEEVVLGDFFDGELPVVLLMGYYDCPLLCDLVFNKTLGAFKELNLTLGKDYRAVTISFDHTNTTSDAAGKQAVMLAGYDGEEGERSWEFLTASATNARAVADSIGYAYKFIPETGEFSHPAAIVIVSPEGVVSNYLYGLQFPERQLRLALVDAAEGRVGGFFDKVLLFCYVYDPNAGSFVLMGRRVMTIGAVATAVSLATLIGGLLLLERRKRRRDSGSGVVPPPRAPRAAPAH